MLPSHPNKTMAEGNFQTDNQDFLSLPLETDACAYLYKL